MASNQLSFSVSLHDRTQRGLASARKGFASLQGYAAKTQASVQGGWMSAGTGAAGMWATGSAFGGLTKHAREMDAARGELMSLLDDNANLTADIVQNQAMDFAERYGKSAAEFVSASYDIQSAIDGLSPQNLASFTNASAVLATATKADTATITNYMGTMYGIFERNAERMGKSNWIEQVAGQSALAVQMFKTNGAALNDAFARVGARGANQNISQAEQFAVLGSLQSTMKGSVAGTAYAGFLDAIPKAQKALNLNLTGDDGKALGILDVIERLKGALGDDLGVKQQGVLNSAFGSNAAGLIQNLWNKTDSLRGSIEKLNGVAGMEKAVSMAQAIADPYEQLEQAIINVKTVFGQALSGSLQPFINYMISGGQTLRRWITLFPNLTKAAGYLVIGLTLLTAGASALALVTGIAQLSWVGLSAIWLVSSGALKLLTLGLWGTLKAMVTLIPTVWGFAAGMIAAIGWIPIAIIGVIAALTALWVYWKEFTDWLSSAWESVKSWFGGGDNVLNVDAQQQEINNKLSATGASIEPVVMPFDSMGGMLGMGGSYATDNSTNIGAVNIQTQQLSDPNALINKLARMTP